VSRPPLQRPTTYDIEQEQLRHDDAVHWFGELNAFLLWWNIQDFNDGLVARCSTCYTAYGDVADAYGQSAQNKCTSCFGTTFEGGLRAIYYRPAIWDTSDVDMDVKKRGFIDTTQGSIQIISNLPVRKGDTVVRADGSRWDLAIPESQEITTGFGSQRGEGFGGSPMRTRARVIKEDPDSVVDLPAVDLTSLEQQGWVAYVPHSPHPNDANAPDPVLQPDPGSEASGILQINRGREFSVTLRFYQDDARTQPKDVSGNTYVSEFREGASALSTVVTTLSQDVSNAANGEIRFFATDAATTAIPGTYDFLYWDVYLVAGSEDISVVQPRRLAVI
jgi:hypothetical protein